MAQFIEDRFRLGRKANPNGTDASSERKMEEPGQVPICTARWNRNDVQSPHLLGKANG